MATVTLFPIAVTDSTGRTSGSVSYSGSGAAFFRVLSDTWVTDDPAILVTFEVQQSFDNGANWQDMCPFFWQPPTLAKDGGLPAGQCTAGDTQGARLLRALLSASAPISIGVSATVA